MVKISAYDKIVIENFTKRKDKNKKKFLHEFHEWFRSGTNSLQKQNVEKNRATADIIYVYDA